MRILAFWLRISENDCMTKRSLKFSDQIRKAVDASGLSRYRICKEIDIAESLMSRFMAGKSWLGQGTLDALANLLRLHVSAEKRPKKG
jgi:transcriptional regulator with XRE-family HTH domain